jgi:outer membrane immunogenic protein
MEKFLLSTVAIAMLSTAASAADLDMAPAPEPMPAYDWTGFYIGAAVGWLGGKTKSRAGLYQDGELLDIYDDFDGRWGRKGSPDGGAFGGYAGYNWQMDNGLILGIEGDFYGVNAKDRKSMSFLDDEEDEVELYGKQKIKSTWAVRGRLGWAIDNFMPYIAGGFAGASMKSTFGMNLYDDDIVRNSDRVSTTKSYTGWTFGAGAEWMVTPSWVLRVDYQYKDLGKKNNPSKKNFLIVPFGPEGSPIGWDLRNRTKLTTNQVTFGAAFKF